MWHWFRRQLTRRRSYRKWGRMGTNTRDGTKSVIDSPLTAITAPEHWSPPSPVWSLCSLSPQSQYLVLLSLINAPPPPPQLPLSPPENITASKLYKHTCLIPLFPYFFAALLSVVVCVYIEWLCNHVSICLVCYSVSNQTFFSWFVLFCFVLGFLKYNVMTRL